MRKVSQVIIGNSGAGLSAIEAIRECDRLCPITLISAENCNAYSPVLTTYYIKGKISREGLFTAYSDFYKANCVKTIFGRKAVGVDTVNHVVRLDNNKKVEYDNLLIASGASPVSLDGSGLDNVLSLRTVEDAERITKIARTAKEIVIIGAGLVSLQATDALFKEGVKFTIMERLRQVLSQNIDATCAAILQKEMESRGISIRLGNDIKEIKRRGKKAIVITGSGEELSADMVIVGGGVTPNIQLVENSGIRVNRGILVDEFMRTNTSNVFAAGDVAEGKDMITGEMAVLPTWTNAVKQGRIAGLNMVGCEQKYEGGLRENITTLFGLVLVSIGLPLKPKGSEMEELVFSDPERKIYRKILLSGNRIVGAVLLGSNSDAGIIQGLIRNRTDISPWKDRISSTCLDMRSRLLPVNDDGGITICQSREIRQEVKL